MGDIKKVEIHLKSLRKVTYDLFSKAMVEMNNIDTAARVDENKMCPLQNVLQSKSNGVKKLYDQLIELIDEENTMEKIMQESVEFELYSKENLLLINEFIDKCRLEGKTPKLSTVDSKRFETSIKLPRIEIKKFNGELTQWKSFIDTFEAGIDKSSLSDVEKFNYLKGYLLDNVLKQ